LVSGEGGGGAGNAGGGAGSAGIFGGGDAVGVSPRAGGVGMGAALLKACSGVRAANSLMPLIASHARTVPAAICRINFTCLHAFELLRVF
jgi:hypothetical protein